MSLIDETKQRLAAEQAGALAGRIAQQAESLPVLPTTAEKLGQIGGQLLQDSAKAPPPELTTDPFAPVQLTNDQITEGQSYDVTGFTPQQIYDRNLATELEKQKEEAARQEAVINRELDAPVEPVDYLFKTPDWETILNKGIYQPSFRNEAQVSADPVLRQLDEQLGGLLSALSKQDSSTGGGFGWVRNAFSKDGPRNYVRSVYLGSDGTYKGNFLGGALYGLGLLWNAPVGAILDAKNAGQALFEMSPPWVRNSPLAFHRWVDERAPLIGEILRPWIKRDPLRDGKSNFVEAFKGAQYSFGDEAGTGIGIKREETLGKIFGVPFNPTAVLGFGLDVVGGNSIDDIIEKGLARLGRGAARATGNAAAPTTAAVANAASDARGPVQLEIPFVTGPIPRNAVPRKPPRRSNYVNPAMRAAGMRNTARNQLTLDFDSLSKLAMPNTLDVVSTATPPVAQGTRILRGVDGQLTVADSAAVGFPAEDVIDVDWSIIRNLPELKRPPSLPGTADLPRLPGTAETPRLPGGTEAPKLPGTASSRLPRLQEAKSILTTDLSPPPISGKPVDLVLPEVKPIPEWEQLALDVGYSPETRYVQELLAGDDVLKPDQVRVFEDIFTGVNYVPEFPTSRQLSFSATADNVLLPDAAINPSTLLDVADEPYATRMVSQSEDVWARLTDGTNAYPVPAQVGDVKMALELNERRIVAALDAESLASVTTGGIKKLYRFFGDLSSRFPRIDVDVEVPAGITVGELRRSSSALRKLGFDLVDSAPGGASLFRFNRQNARIQTRFATAAQTLGLDVTAANRIGSIRQGIDLLRTIDVHSQALDKQITRYVEKLFDAIPGRRPTEGVIREITLPKSVEIPADLLTSPPTTTLYHGTRSNADILTVDAIRGGSESSSGVGLHLTDNRYFAELYATRHPNVDLPETTLASMGNGRVYEIAVTPGKVLDGHIVLPDAYAETLKRSFPELADVDLTNKTYSELLDTVSRNVDRDTSREFQVHLAELLRAGGVDLVHFDDGYALLNPAVATISQTFGDVATVTSEYDSLVAKLRLLVDAPDSALDNVDRVESYLRMLYKTLDDIQFTASDVRNQIDELYDGADLWRVGETPVDLSGTNLESIDVQSTPIRKALPGYNSALEDVRIALEAEQAAPTILPHEVRPDFELTAGVEDFPIRLDELPTEVGVPVAEGQLSFSFSATGNVYVNPLYTPRYRSPLDDEWAAILRSDPDLEKFGNVYSKKVGSTKLSLERIGDDVEVSFTVGDTYARVDGRDVPMTELKNLSRTFANLSARHPTVRFTATIAAGSLDEFYSKEKFYASMGFVAFRVPEGTRIKNLTPADPYLLIYVPAEARLAKRLQTAANQLFGLDAARNLPIETAEEGTRLLEELNTMRKVIQDKLQASRDALDRIGVDLSRKPNPSPVVRPRGQLSMSHVTELLEGDPVELYHGTTVASIDPNFDSIRGGSESSHSMGLQASFTDVEAQSFADVVPQIDTPTATLAKQTGRPVIFTLIPDESVKSIEYQAIEFTAENLDHLMETFPEIDLSSLPSPTPYTELFKHLELNYPADIRRQVKIHIAEALRDAGVDVIYFDSVAAVLSPAKMTGELSPDYLVRDFIHDSDRLLSGSFAYRDLVNPDLPLTSYDYHSRVVAARAGDLADIGKTEAYIQNELKKLASTPPPVTEAGNTPWSSNNINPCSL